MSTDTPADTANTNPADPEEPGCWCCDGHYPEGDLVRLGAHPEVGVCADCAHFLDRRARAAHATPLTRRLHASGDRIRDAVLARHWHEHPRIGPPLKWLNRHLPW